jgi:phosphoglycolate phosphatase
MNAAALFWSRRWRVFDLDGTLVDTLPDLAGALNQALRESRLPAVPAPLVRASLHAGLEGSVAAALVYLNAPAEMRGLVLARYRRHYDLGLALRSAPYPGVARLLAAVAARREPMAICTNKPQRQAEALLSALGLNHHFAVVVGADTCSERKPHPLPLLHALRRLGGPPEEALFVGDSEVDAACAAAAGVPHLWFAGGYGVVDAHARRAHIDAFDALLAPGGSAPPLAGPPQAGDRLNAAA